MSETPAFRGGRNIALKVPAHQFDATIESYRALKIPIRSRTESSVCFEFGPIWLHVDRVTHLSQAEIWLEFITTDVAASADVVARAGFVRCDEVEALAEDFDAFWVSSPASIVHLVAGEE
jgi:hypothetical protein